MHDRPSNAVVASFIGKATLLFVLRGSVRLGDLVLRTARALPDCRDPMLAVQTEKLVLDDRASADGMNRLVGTVTDIVYQARACASSSRLPETRR